MAGETIKCRDCDCKVKLSDVENDDGNCPECGQPVLATALEGNFGNEDDFEMDDDEELMDGEYENEESDGDDYVSSDDGTEPDILDELNEEDDFGSTPKRRKRRYNPDADFGMDAPPPPTSPVPSAKPKAKPKRKKK